MAVPMALEVHGTHLKRTSVPRKTAGARAKHPQAPRRASKAVAKAQTTERTPAQAQEEEFAALAQVCAVLGSQWGDEGKGKLVDVLAQKYDVVARGQGGANAGHTIYDSDGNQYKLHLMPSGVLNPDAQCIIGNGVVVNLPSLFEEIKGLEGRGICCKGRVLVSDRAHLLFDFHKEVDGLREEELAGKKIGTTKRGIGPCYSNKAIRNGIRVGDLNHPDVFAEKLARLVDENRKRFAGSFDLDVEAEVAAYKEYFEELRPYIGDSVHVINQAYSEGKRILVEGANATMLDLDFGTYPYVTSSNPSIGGVCTGLGLSPHKFGCVIGVAKAYTTRVGEGPYPTELFGEMAERVREEGGEYGTTTGRPRRCGWLDVVALDYACTINGFTHLNITKLDVLSVLDEIKLGVAYKAPNGDVLPAFPSDLTLLEQVEVVYETLPGWKSDISKCRTWSDLPAAAQAYVRRVEELTGVECRWIGVGPGREALITKDE
uniref:Adenylosuccinate synthetase, chloroplastic n=1 Tax=Picocystis salinarum TaxID=88271 RepID=A0A7S3XG82_9CHLO